MRVATGKDDPALAETSWPLPDKPHRCADTLQWRLRYGTSTHSNLLRAAEVLDAYEALLAAGTTTQQTKRLAALRRVHRRKR